MRRATVAILAALASTACADLLDPGEITRDEDAGIQTDALSYTLVRTGDVLHAPVQLTINNAADDDIVITNCGGATAVALEKRVSLSWVTVWSPPIPACLSRDIVVPAHGSYLKPFEIYSCERESCVPRFTTRSIAGEYRLRLQSMRRGTGLREEETVSNRFRLEVAPS